MYYTINISYTTGGQEDPLCDDVTPHHMVFMCTWLMRCMRCGLPAHMLPVKGAFGRRGRMRTTTSVDKWNSHRTAVESVRAKCIRVAGRLRWGEKCSQYVV